MTNYELAKFILESITTTSITGGVLFAMYQIVLGRRTAAVTTYQKIIELHVMLRKMRVDQPTLYKIDNADAKMFDDIPKNKRDEAVRKHFFNLMRLSVFEFAWIADQKRQLPGDYYKDIEERFKEVLQDSDFANILNSKYAKLHNSDFIKYARTLSIASIYDNTYSR